MTTKTTKQKIKTVEDRFEACAAQHFGLWAVLPDALSAGVAAYNAGQLPKVVTEGRDMDGNPIVLYSVDENGVSTLAINGKITKGRSSFGGTSSVFARHVLRKMEVDDDVKGVMLAIDSPGGTVSGQMAFADDIHRIAQKKIVAAHAEDLMASAALWAGTQASFVSASPMTEVGSIGTFRVLYDTSEAMAKEGIKVHMIASGPTKGAGMQGTPITDDIVQRDQARVMEVNEFFLQAVKRGRNLGIAQVRELATGETWMAGKAKENGLIDAVMSYEDAYTNLVKMTRQKASQSRLSAASRRTRTLEVS